MTKNIFSVFVAVLLSSLTFISCSSDDDVEADSIIGKWYVTNVESSSAFGEVEEEWEVGDWILFNEDETCTWTQIGEIINAKYEIDNNILSVFDIDSEDFIPFSYKIAKLTSDELILTIEAGGLLEARIELER